MRTRVFLSPADPRLDGKFPPDAEHIHVICDSSAGAFEVTLPDVGASEEREYLFYNVPLTGAGNTVTIRTKHGQYIGASGTSVDVAPGEEAGFVSSLKKYWVGGVGSGGGGTSDHRLLSHLNSTSYWHLTQAQATDLTDGGSTTLHTHDSLAPSGLTGVRTFVE